MECCGNVFIFIGFGERNVMKDFLRLIRIKHYIKNLLIFLPIIFSKNLFNANLLFQTVASFMIFSLLTSVIYVFNDLMDMENDKLHPIKKKRPLASGKITKKQAVIIIFVLTIICVISSIALLRTNILSYIILTTYFIINICYSYKLKKIPIIDVCVLATGYLLRVFFGAVVISVPVSQWLYLTILSISFYMGMGKRRNELNNISTNLKTREVLKYYNKDFLDKNMYMCLNLAIVFYSLWCLDIGEKLNFNIIYTIPIVIVISMKYSLNIEKEDSTGDPIELILKDKVLIIFLSSLSLLIGINYIF